MKSDQFQRQMDRLIVQFGKGVYSTERCALIWQTVRDLPEQSWVRMVSKLLGECRQAPLLPEIRELLAIERERAWGAEKRQHEKDAQEFFKSSYGTDEQAQIARTIIDRMQGRMSDSAWEGFLSGLNVIARDAERIARGQYVPS